MQDEMPTIARVVVPEVPHHVVQRGNRRQSTFFAEEDYELYKELLSRWCRRLSVAIWCYCLMPNHVHLILVPSDPAGLARAVGETHKRYTLTVNRREGWSGYLWQGSFASFPMSEAHLFNAVRYVLLNPVRARLAASAEGWPHSSARAHLHGRPDGVVDLKPLASRIEDWPRALAPGEAEPDLRLLRKHASTGRPLGDPDFLRLVETRTGRRL